MTLSWMGWGPRGVGRRVVRARAAAAPTLARGAFGVFGVFVALGALGASGCSEPARAAVAADERVVVELVRVATGPVARPVEASATLRAKRDYDLAFQIPGLVREVRVDVGQRVRRGQVLASIDATTIVASLHQAEEGRTKALRDRDRAELLGRGGAVPQAVLDDARTAATLADASLSSARHLASNTVLVAPEDGVVAARDVDLGEVVAAGRPILRMTGVSSGWVATADVVDRDAVALRPGAGATLTLDALPGRALRARVGHVAPAASRGTGTFEVELNVDGDGADLLSGLTGRVAITREVDVPARVPIAALVEGDGDRGVVFTVEGGKARRREVGIAFLLGDEVALSTPVGASAVVGRGAERLVDGVAVRVAGEPAAGATP